MNVLVDMGLSPQWCAALEAHGLACRHWSTVGGPGVSDATLLGWALENERIVLTHDLPVGAILAAMAGGGPSVVQVRGQDVLPDMLPGFVAQVLKRHEESLADGVILMAYPQSRTAKILPLAP